MTDHKASSNDRLIGALLAVVGTLLLLALAAFVVIAIGFRQSFSATLPPLEDMTMGFAMLSPIVVIALLLIGYGRHLLRKK